MGRGSRQRGIFTGWRASLCLVLAAVLCAGISACSLPTSSVARSKPVPSPTSSFGHVALFPLSSGVPAPNRLVAGPDGAIWFTAFDLMPVEGMADGRPIHDAIVRMTSAGAFTLFPLPDEGVYPDGIIVGSDGNLWFTEFYGNAVGRITPQGTITEFFVPSRPHRNPGDLPQSQPHALALGADGNIWFPDMGGNMIARITPSGRLTEFAIPAHAGDPFSSYPYSIAAGSDGALWFTESGGMRIGRITLDGHITEFTLPGVNHVPEDIVTGGDGALWFLEQNQSLLGRMTTDGHFTEWPLPHRACHIQAAMTYDSYGACEVKYLARGSDGAIWISEPWLHTLSRIDETGHITEFPLPPISTSMAEPSVVPVGPDLFNAMGEPSALAAGPDGALWFSYSTGVGRFSV